MSFSILPAELQIEVFSYLENTDLKAVRGVSASCRDNASPHLFRSIIACTRYQAMGAFQNIALHPVYQKYVKEIVFDATAYDAGEAKVESAYQSSALARPHLREVVSWVRHGRWKQYQSLYQEQEEIKEGVLLQTVARALEWMPHVESIAYCSHPLHVPVEKKLMKDILERRVPSPAWDGSIQAARYAANRPTENGFHHLIGAICVAQYSNIHEFRVRMLSHDGYWSGPRLALGEFQFKESDHLESGKYFFRNLRKIELDLDMRYTAQRREALANMRTLLAEAKHLCQLRLHAEPNHNMQESLAWLTAGENISPFASLGLGLYWPELRIVDLGRIIATEDELRGLVHRGGDTLTSMKFTNSIITAGKWSNLTDEVVYGTKISTFILNRVHEEYVLRGMAFEHLRGSEHEKWMYEGQLKENTQGERYFWEHPGKSVYAWRDLPSNEAGSSEVD
ncbi:uncharacterized protein N0V89_006316 [Didymosphaeria variabile]|uniref:F-box domain-containing protein n=1 Tax=Didymosphaeria variabile TaxID=1932322 RepID=A0A9W9CCA7_9PLEO|nr:uncharacterized protein N0V89_006316 [Didymosphaeria variabile]KAJ4354579.1 hypothetical protein N0V89_006316 [Didymosphaeria variabile]